MPCRITVKVRPTRYTITRRRCVFCASNLGKVPARWVNTSRSQPLVFPCLTGLGCAVLLHQTARGTKLADRPRPTAADPTPTPAKNGAGAREKRSAQPERERKYARAACAVAADGNAVDRAALTHERTSTAKPLMTWGIARRPICHRAREWVASCECNDLEILLCRCRGVSLRRRRPRPRQSCRHDAGTA